MQVEIEEPEELEMEGETLPIAQMDWGPWQRLMVPSLEETLIHMSAGDVEVFIYSTEPSVYLLPKPRRPEHVQNPILLPTGAGILLSGFAVVWTGAEADIYIRRPL